MHCILAGVLKGWFRCSRARDKTNAQTSNIDQSECCSGYVMSQDQRDHHHRHHHLQKSQRISCPADPKPMSRIGNKSIWDTLIQTKDHKLFHLLPLRQTPRLQHVAFKIGHTCKSSRICAWCFYPFTQTFETESVRFCIMCFVLDLLSLFASSYLLLVSFIFTAQTFRFSGAALQAVFHIKFPSSINNQYREELCVFY